MLQTDRQENTEEFRVTSGLTSQDDLETSSELRSVAGDRMHQKNGLSLGRGSKTHATQQDFNECRLLLFIINITTHK
jgi:hypothetical protein